MFWSVFPAPAPLPPLQPQIPLLQPPMPPLQPPTPLLSIPTLEPAVVDYNRQKIYKKQTSKHKQFKALGIKVKKETFNGKTVNILCLDNSNQEKHQKESLVNKNHVNCVQNNNKKHKIYKKNTIELSIFIF